MKFSPNIKHANIEKGKYFFFLSFGLQVAQTCLVQSHLPPDYHNMSVFRGNLCFVSIMCNSVVQKQHVGDLVSDFVF